MRVDPSRITVSIARSQVEINQALEFCASIYQRNYGTYWTVPPDRFFVAKEDGEIVATGGLTFAALHPQIASERYFLLSDGMRLFIHSNRQRIGEFGRFTSVRIQAAKAILHSALDYCTMSGVDFLFAWANPSVYKHTSDRLGLHFWPIPVPLNLESAMADSRWASPPAGFFQRKQPPALHLGVVPFWENAKMVLAEECGMAMTTAMTPREWQIPAPIEVQATTRKPKPFVHAVPKLMRSDADVGAPQQDSDVFPDISFVSEPDAQLRRKPPQVE